MPGEHRKRNTFAAWRPFRVPRFALRIALCGLLLGASRAHAGPMVRTESGFIQGASADGMKRFLGIPYAAPPTGEWRWKPPQPASAWQGVRNATAFGGICPQTAAVGEFSAPSTTEDCLSLNVFAPSEPAHAKKLVVMVWIPGGGLFAGGGSHYNPASLVATGQVIVVTVNYRLGLLGFFAQPDIDGEGHAFADYGLLDQQAALKWVQRNIAAFGGDPDNVTIFGESAGAVSVYAHLASPESAGLFHRAILQSGLTHIPKPSLVLPLADASALGQKFAAAVGCTQKVAACLRRVPVQQIIDRQMPFLAGLIVGGKSVPEPLETALQAGRFNRVPVLNGTNHDEWRWPAARMELNSGTPLTTDAYRAALADFFGDVAPAVETEYAPGSFGSPSEALAAAQTDAVFACTAMRTDAYLSRYVPLYGYEFNYARAPMYMPPVSFPYGAAHTAELQFIFPNFYGGRGAAHALSPQEAALAATMARYWTHFAKHGDPNQAGLPFWPRFSAPAKLLLSLDLPQPTPLSTFAANHRCEFWARVMPR